MKRLFGTLVLLALVAGFAAGARGEAEASTTATLAYEPTTVLVMFDDATQASARGSAHREVGGVVVNRFDWLNLDVVRIPAGASPTDVASRYGRLGGVANASPNWIYTIDETDSIPNDTRFSEMYGLHNTGQTGGTPDADIDAPEGWDLAFGPGNFPTTGGVRIGTLDTGIDQTHPDLAGKTKACARATSGTGVITEGQCPDDHSHGTHVAGTITALTNNALGVAGVATNAELAVFKGFNSGGQGSTADLIAGWHWLHTTGQAVIINHSWGGGGSPGLAAEATEAHNAGTLSIAAAGNCGCGIISFPAGYPEVVSVPATDHNDLRASFSAFNADTEVAGPGVNILSTIPVAFGSYDEFSGTSMATPHVVGVAGLVKWKFGTDANGTRAILDVSVDDLGAPGRDPQYGFGRINLSKALGPPPEPGAIAGKVRKRNGNPLADATVNCTGAGSDTTDANGDYEISPVNAGTYSCTASKVGWRPKTKPVTVTAGQTAILNFKLRKA